jgi:hypothetical protein
LIKTYREQDEFSNLQMYKTPRPLIKKAKKNYRRLYSNNYKQVGNGNNIDSDQYDEEDEDEDESADEKYCCDCPCCRCPWPIPNGVWCVKDACGLVCATITWFLVLYAEFVVLFVMIIPAPFTIGSFINTVVFQVLAFLALASHAAAMLTDPGTVPLGNATEENIQKMTTYPGQVIYRCPRCLSIKPLRAHHCRLIKKKCKLIAFVILNDLKTINF